MFKIERPEIVAWDFAQYARLLAAAKVEGDEWYAAVCLAGEAGLRVGETKAFRWREDVDLIARTITVNQQTCKGDTGTPKGRTRRTVPMTATLYDALNGWPSSAKASWCEAWRVTRRPTAKLVARTSGSAGEPACRFASGTRSVIMAAVDDA